MADQKTQNTIGAEQAEQDRKEAEAADPAWDPANLALERELELDGFIRHCDALAQEHPGTSPAEWAERAYAAAGRGGPDEGRQRYPEATEFTAEGLPREASPDGGGREAEAG